MQEYLQISIQGLPQSEAIEELVRSRAARLERICPKMTSCRVVVAAPHHHQHRHNLLTVKVHVLYPGGEVAATRDNSDDACVLVREAFDAVRRELGKALRRRGARAAEPHHGLQPE